MIKRRVKAAGLPDTTCCHTFRATGITAYLNNGGTLDKARQIAAHESSNVGISHRYRRPQSSNVGSSNRYVSVLAQARSTSQRSTTRPFWTTW